MLSRRRIKERYFDDPSAFFSGTLWIPVSVLSALLAVLFAVMLILGAAELVRDGRYVALVLISLLDLLFIFGTYYVISDGAVRVTVGSAGVKAAYFGRELADIEWSEVHCIYVQHETSRGTDKYILLAKANVEPKAQYDAVRHAKHGISQNPDVLLVLPYKEKRTQMLRQFAPQRISMRYLERIKP